MKWFKLKYTVCSECGVHFEPVTGYESRWGNLCSVHRKPVMERSQRKDAVITWASYNWERLEEMYKKEEEEKRKAFYIFTNPTSVAAEQQRQMQNLGMQGLGRFGGVL